MQCQNSQPDENNEATQISTETAADIKQKGDPNPTSVNKPGNKNGKQGSQCSDPPKEDYIHIRARRGQATNSHSLAERVRLVKYLRGNEKHNLECCDVYFYMVK